jgi:hypothetical protein
MSLHALQSFFLSLPPIEMMSLNLSSSLLWLRLLLLNVPALGILFLALLSVVPIMCKWVYKIKTRSYGSIEHFKVCPIACRFQ